MTKPRDYSFLNEPLTDFIRAKGILAKGDRIQGSKMLREDFDLKLREMIRGGKLTEYEAKIVKGIEGLPPERLTFLAALQTELSNFVHEQPMQFLANPAPKKAERRALDWTMVQLEQFCLKGLRPREIYEAFLSEGSLDLKVVMGYPYQGLYRQCYWCGWVDLEGTQFARSNQKYCHAADCEDTSLSNPAAHPNCCAGDVYRIRRAYKERLRNYSTSLSKAEYTEKAIKSFKSLCEKLYMDNLSKNTDVTNEFTHKMMVFSKHLAGQPPLFSQLAERLKPFSEAFSFKGLESIFPTHKIQFGSLLFKDKDPG